MVAWAFLAVGPPRKPAIGDAGLAATGRASPIPKSDSVLQFRRTFGQGGAPPFRGRGSGRRPECPVKRTQGSEPKVEGDRRDGRPRFGRIGEPALGGGDAV